MTFPISIYIYVARKISGVDYLKIFITKAERQSNKKVKVIRFDRGGEYYDKYDETD